MTQDVSGQTLRECNRAIVRAQNEQALLDKICGIICDKAGYRMAWAGYAENDSDKTVRPVAWAGVERGYLARARITWAETEQGRGPTGSAIRTGKSACIQNSRSNLRGFAPPLTQRSARAYFSPRMRENLLHQLVHASCVRFPAGS